MSGKFGSADLAAGVDTLLCTAPAGKTPTVNVRVANRNDTPVIIHVAIGTGASPVAKDYVAYNQVIVPNGIYEDTGLVMSAAENLWVTSDSANVSARVHGFGE